MLNNQDARRNLSAVDRLLAAEKLREKIAEEAKLRQKEAGGDRKSDEYKQDRSSPIGEKRLDNKTEIHTDKELAKISGVSTGTIARYKQVMKSDDEELKEKVKSGEMTIIF